MWTLEYILFGSGKRKATMRVCVGEDYYQARGLYYEWLGWVQINSLSPVVESRMVWTDKYIVSQMGDVEKKRVLLWKAGIKRYRFSLPNPVADLSSVPSSRHPITGELGTLVGMQDIEGR